jgi:Arm DNA-binding domain
MLTDLAVKNMRSGPTTREIPDGRDGLYLIVQPSGHKAWAVRYLSRGRQVKLGLGRYPARTLAEARIRAIAARERAKNAERYGGIITTIGITLGVTNNNFAPFIDLYEALFAIKYDVPDVIRIDEILDAIDWWFEDIGAVASLRLLDQRRKRKQTRRTRKTERAESAS